MRHASSTALAVRGTTKVYAVIGDPVAHSLSPPMHNAAFAALGIDAVYVPFLVAPAELATAVAGFRAAGLGGWNVTVPHKEAIVRLLDDVRPRARACGAVNTVVRTRRGVVGDNTDGVGFLAALAEARRPARAAEILMIGAGGSARAVAHALVRAGCARLVVANRTPQRAQALVATLATGRASAVGLDRLRDPRALARFDLIVNCTSAALGRARLPSLPFAATRPDVLCVDLAYGAPSRFLARARAAGRRTLDGAGMLLHQGALAFELWTGRAAPLAVMRRALARALADRAMPEEGRP